MENIETAQNFQNAQGVVLVREEIVIPSDLNDDG